MNVLTTDVLVVGGGTGGTAAAIQAARRGVQTILVSEFPWLGGMLTSAGVSAPDGNELAAFQTGLWGAFLRSLHHRQPGGLDHGWVSFFTFEPHVGAAILADWVRSLPHLTWIAGRVPQAVQRSGDRLTAVSFADVTIQAQVILDGTELGDLLALGEVPHRWGWEWRSQWQEPSAPLGPNALTESYPIQCPTWVVVLRDGGKGVDLPEIVAPPVDRPEQFAGAWEGYGAEAFLNYGRLPGDRFMINWPQCGNDYGMGLHRLVASQSACRELEQEARWHAQSFARFIQQSLGQRYGLAGDTFPQISNCMGGGAFALHPYHRESRRLIGLTTLAEPGILPQGRVAPLPVNAQGEMEAIALGNYPNDHHYPAAAALDLTPKALRWGGRWTGTPFTIPYRSLVPEMTDGLLVCEKNISVSHIANGASRLQPVVMGIGQAAGMAAALCVEQHCQPRQLSVRSLQDALLTDALAPAAIVPLFNLTSHHAHWLRWQRYYRDHPDVYPLDGDGPEIGIFSEKSSQFFDPLLSAKSPGLTELEGVFHRVAEQTYRLVVEGPESIAQPPIHLVTLHGEGDRQLRRLPSPQRIRVWGWLNRSGHWLRVERLQPCDDPDAAQTASV